MGVTQLVEHEWIYRGDTNCKFTWAISEIRANWRSEIARFLSEGKP